MNEIAQDLNKADVAFVLDVTGSMSGFINAAKKQLIDISNSLSKGMDIDLNIGIVEYCDFPPQDSMLTKVHPFSTDLAKVQKDINGIKLYGGGDTCEAVYQGLADACNKLEWRQRARRFIILVGDAPPHAYEKWRRDNGLPAVHAGSDGFAQGCPSGFNPQSISALCESNNVVVYGVAMKAGAVFESFNHIATPTGGFAKLTTEANAVIKSISDAMGQEFETMDFDKTVYSLTQLPDTDLETDDGIEVAARSLGTTYAAVVGSKNRLTKRGFLELSILED